MTNEIVCGIPDDSYFVILSGVRPDKGGTNGVEGSPKVWQRGKLPEILRLRKTPLRSVLLRSE